MNVLRVFPRRTKATPIDSMVRIGAPTLFDQADAVEISVTFDWDKGAAEDLAELWGRVTSNVTVGGPAYGDPGADFIAGKFLKHGYVITSRGCTNKCWFCYAWKREGQFIRELPIVEGHIIQDNNLLACSQKHQESVFSMLLRQKKRAIFSGGIEAKLLTAWHIEWFAKLHPQALWFAYDEPADYEPLAVASKMLRDAGILSAAHTCMCYVLIGQPDDTIEKAERRLINTIKLGFMPFAMLFNKERRDWFGFQRQWANPIIVGTKMREVLSQ